MKRSEIINQLLNEGFSSKTLMNFSDKQLLSLSSRINESLTVSQKTLDDPNAKAKVTAMSKTDDVKIVPESGVPGLKAKVIKKTGVPGLKAKKMNMKEEGAMPGLTIKGKSTVSNPTSKKTVKPENEEEEEIDEKKKTYNFDKKKTSGNKDEKGKEFNFTKKKNTTDTEDKKEGKVSKKQAFLDMIKKKKENKSINEWVDDVAQKHYRPFTTKNDIMEMIMTKLDEVEMEESEVGVEKLPKFLKYQAIKGSGAAPAPAEPKTKPGTKPTPKQNPGERPKTPYQPGPGINPSPKAKMGVNVTPKTMPKV